MSTSTPPDRDPDDPLYSDGYYELLERLFGEEKAAWIVLPDVGSWTSIRRFQFPNADIAKGQAAGGALARTRSVHEPDETGAW